MDKNNTNNNKLMLLGSLIAGFLMVGSITTIGNDINVAHIYNVTNGAGLVIGSMIDGVNCQATYCIYHPWYDSSSTYAKNGTTGYIDYSGTNSQTVIQSAITQGQNHVYILDGTYTVSSVELSQSDILEGSGVNTILQGTAGSPVVQVNSSNGTADYVNIKNIQISGTSTSDGVYVIGVPSAINFMNVDNVWISGAKNSVNVSHCNECNWEHILIQNGYGYGWFAPLTGQVNINNYIHQFDVRNVNGYGIYQQSADEGMKFSQITVIQAKNANIRIEAGVLDSFDQFIFDSPQSGTDGLVVVGGRQLYFTNGYVTASGTNVNGAVVRSIDAPIFNVRFDKVSIADIPYRAVDVEGDTYAIYDVLFQNGDMTNCGKQTGGADACILVEGSSNLNNITLSNNYISPHTNTSVAALFDNNPKNAQLYNNIVTRGTISTGNAAIILNNRGASDYDYRFAGSGTNMTCFNANGALLRGASPTSCT